MGLLNYLFDRNKFDPETMLYQQQSRCCGADIKFIQSNDNREPMKFICTKCKKILDIDEVAN